MQNFCFSIGEKSLDIAHAELFTGDGFEQSEFAVFRRAEDSVLVFFERVLANRAFVLGFCSVEMSVVFKGEGGVKVLVPGDFGVKA